MDKGTKDMVEGISWIFWMFFVLILIATFSIYFGDVNPHTGNLIEGSISSAKKFFFLASPMLLAICSLVSLLYVRMDPEFSKRNWAIVIVFSIITTIVIAPVAIIKKDH